MLFKVLLAGVLILLSPVSFAGLNLIQDQETLQYLFDKAAHLSGIPAYSFSELPPVYSVSKEELGEILCPEDPQNCRNLAAVFDDLEYRILVRDDFEVSSQSDAFDNSFVIHEFVHSLQYRARGAEIFNGCAALYETEREAYAVQDQYLKSEGEFFRAGIALRSFYCEEGAAKDDYQKSKAKWDERHSTGKWKL